MILIFNESLKDIDDDAKMGLAKLVLGIMDNKHYLQVSSSMWDWLEKNILINQYLGREDIEKIRTNTQFRDVPNSMKKYLSQINIGYGQEDVEPSKASLLITNPSYIVVENGFNDWHVLRKWIELMKNDHTFKSINTLVEQKKSMKAIQASNAGSAGQIINSLLAKMDIFKELTRYKVISVCDSDRDACDAKLSKEKVKIQEFSNENSLINHILYKREIENYFDLKYYQKAGFADEDLSYDNSTYGWDFEDVEKYIKNESKSKFYQKKNLRTLCEYINRKGLIKIVEHHPVKYEGFQINEIQSLILKIAKVI